MLNPAQRLMVARGMSGIGLGNSIDDAFNRIGTDADPSGGNWYTDWGQGLIGQGLTTLTSIFGHNNTPQGPTAAQIAAAIAAQNAARNASNNDDSGSGLGNSFESNYLKLGGAKIPYSMLLLGGVAVMMIQSKGFERRR